MSGTAPSDQGQGVRFGWIANPDYREDDHHYRRRPFLLDPGQSLLLTSDPVRAAINYGLFKNETGITSGDDLVASRMSPTPLPTNAGRPADGSRRRVAGLRAEAMWMPTLWLPPDVTRRRRFQISGGEVISVPVDAPTTAGVYWESEELWVIRLCLELSESGIYDPYTGTWLDTLGLIGVDIDEPRSVARVQQWLDGGPDAELDLLDSGLELGAILSDDADPGWALSSALAMYDQMLECSWALGADSLADVARDLLSDIADNPDVDPDDCQFMLEMLCVIGPTWFAGDGRSPGVSPDDEEDNWWRQVAQSIPSFGGGKRACLAIAPDIIEHLTGIRDRYWPEMEAAVAAFAGGLRPSR